MSLDFNYSKVKNQADLFHAPDADGQERMKAHLDSMIWATMAIGISAITHKNAGEVFRRLHIYEAVSGGMRQNKDDEIFFTFVEVTSLIGLYTNASTKTAKQFDDFIMGILNRNATEKLRNELRAGGEALAAEQKAG